MSVRDAEGQSFDGHEANEGRGQPWVEVDRTDGGSQTFYQKPFIISLKQQRHTNLH